MINVEYYNLIILIPVIIMVISDFRRREVSLLWLLAFCTGSVIISMNIYGLYIMTCNILSNFFLLLYLLLGVTIYLRARYKHWINPFRKYLGGGDAVFLLGIAPLFPIHTYISFLVVTFSCTLCVWWPLSKIKKRNITIPLISVIGTALCIYIAVKNMTV